ncbi:MAG: A/G-specific adenine glycosylase, partial [Anaerolineales bacterium]|nr:A/G-specific adenine glycosylase [Anaerolineales bacterium]
MNLDGIGFEPELVAGRMLAWWDAGHDSFPWRETTDPYAIWVSEVMLQQTQVATVIPYFERWMERFPTVESLAGATLEAVLKQWEGLGYYSRARNLLRAAQQVIEEYGGRLPANLKELIGLAGIGRYTAGAIASIAFGQPAAVLDGNVIRVLARLFDLDKDVTQAATRRRLEALAGLLVPSERPGDYNQAMMELGRKVCRPVQPICGNCPLKLECLSKAHGTQLDRPVRPPRKRTPHFDVTAGVIWQEGSGVNDGPRRVLIAQRRVDDMLGGLWEFPGGK